MSKKILWFLLSCLIIVAVVLGSCKSAVEEAAPVVEEEEEEEETTVVTPPTVEEEEEEEAVPAGPEMVYDSLGRLVEKPRHGGTLRIFMGATSLEYITPAKNAGGAELKELIYEWWLQRDWTKGPVGTGVHTYNGSYMSQETFTGGLCESYETPDEYTIIYHVREGVRFQNKAPAWGREYTASDVQRIVEWNWGTPWSYYYINPATPEEDRTQFEILDDYTFMLIYQSTSAFRPYIWDGNWQAAPEILEHVTPEGELPWENDWKYACGTGPFILKDAVADSAYEFVRNDLYWQNDPLHPDLQLPYVDRVLGLVVPDKAVQYSALQTGKIDVMLVDWTKAETFKTTNPEMLYTMGSPSYSDTVWFRADLEPFSDVRVRRALAMGFDNKKMIEQFYGGNALLNGWPLLPGQDGYTPYEDLPDDCKVLFEYHPEEAKALLADAGFPNGLTVEISVGWDSAEEQSLIIADDWKTIGVNAEVVRYDISTFVGMAWQKDYPGITTINWENASPISGQAGASGGMYPPPTYNFGLVVDPVAEEALKKFNSMVLKEQLAERTNFWKQENLRVMALAWQIYIPTPYPIIFWWPWLQNNNGVVTLGRGTEVGTNVVWRYVWIDQDMKQQMTGLRD